MSVFETLTKPSSPDQLGDSDLLTAICQHLNRLLNSRRDSMAYHTYYGLPDLGEVYRCLPGGLAKLSSDIEQVIRRYEPRVAFVECRQFELDGYSGQVSVTINITTVNRDCSKLFTRLSPNEPMIVSI